MEENYKLAKWLNDEMTDKELIEFQSESDFHLYQKIKLYSSELEVPHFNEQQLFSKVMEANKETPKVIAMRPNWFLRIAAIVVIGLGLLYTYTTFTTTSEMAEKGKKTSFSLPDNSEVVLNSDSEIEYEKEMIKLQVELMKLQNHIKESGEKLLIIFEWRDAAGKWGTIKRFREYLNPRGAEVVALEKPNEQEKTQWYFQRYTKYLPGAGEIKFFDRSWYNRAWVEPVMWFVTKKAYENFLEEVPDFEKMIVDSDIKLIKFYFSVSKEEQAKRFLERKTNPLKQYKLSPVDQFSQQLWDKYTLAEYHNFTNTHSKHAPWTIIKSDNKKKARINAIKHVLNLFNYKDKIKDSELEIDDEILISGEEKAEKLKKEIDTKQDLFE